MKNKIIILIILISIFSCSSKKSVLYLQDINSSSVFDYKMKEHIIEHGAILDISIKSKDPEALIPLSESINSGNFISRESLIFKGFQVDIDGFIEYPEIGKVKASGLTVNQLGLLISKKLELLEILSDAHVEVKILNSNFTILGEVMRPGKYYFDESNLNILQAIGMAGDLTINGVRDDIKLIRNTKDKQVVFNLDFTNSNFFTDEAFQIFSGDIIIINPNSSRVKNAGIIGNSGTLLSLLSFLLSSIIVITR